MKNKIWYIVIGWLISGAILLPFVKKMRAEEKKQEEELMKQVDNFAKDSMEEELRHKKTMEDIRKEGEKEIKEMDEEFRKDMEKTIEKVGKSIQEFNLNTGDVIHCMVKYRDENGEMHEFDAADPKEFRKVMSNRKNTLIFD